MDVLAGRVPPPSRIGGRDPPGLKPDTDCASGIHAVFCTSAQLARYVAGPLIPAAHEHPTSPADLPHRFQRPALHLKLFRRRIILMLA
jgi:hypothetical protein